MAVVDELVALLGFEITGERNLKKFRKGVGGADKSVNKLAASARSMGRIVKGVLLAIGAGKVLSGAIKFESSVADINKVVDATPKQMQALSKELLKMSRDMPVSADGLAEIAAAAGQAGIKFADLTTFTRKAALAAVAFDLPAGKVGDIMAKLGNVFKFNIEQLGLFNDTVNHLSNNMAAKAGEILGFTNKAAAAARQLNISADELAGFGAALISAGIVPQTAARAVTTFASRVQAGGKEVEKAFRTMGESRNSFLKKLQKQGGQKTLLEFFQKMSKLDITKQSKILKGLMGLDFSDDFGKFLSNPELLAKGFTLASDKAGKAGSVLKEYAARAATTENKLQLILNVLKSIAIVLSGPVLDGIKTASDWVMRIVNAFDMAKNSTDGLAGAITSIVAGFKGLNDETDQEQISEIFGNVKTQIEVVKGYLNTGITFIKNKFKELTSFLSTQSAQKYLKSVFDFGDGTMINTTFQNIKDAFSILLEGLDTPAFKVFVGAIGELVVILAKLFGMSVGNGLKLIATAFTTLFKVISKLAAGDLIGALEAFGEGIGRIVEVVTDHVAAIAKELNNFIERLTGVDVAAAISTWVKAFVTMFVDFTTMLDKMIVKAKEVASQLGSALAAGIKSALFGVVNWFISEINSIIAAVNNIPGVNISKVGLIKSAKASANAGKSDAASIQPAAASDVSPEMKKVFADLTAILKPGANAALAYQSMQTGSGGKFKGTVATTANDNRVTNVQAPITVNQTVTGVTAPDAAGRAVQRGVRRGTQRGTVINNNAAVSQ